MEYEIIANIVRTILILLTTFALYQFTKHLYYTNFEFPKYVREFEKKGYVTIGREHYKLLGNFTFMVKSGNGRYYKVDSIEEVRHLVPLTSDEKRKFNLCPD